MDKKDLVLIIVIMVGGFIATVTGWIMLLIACKYYVIEGLLSYMIFYIRLIPSFILITFGMAAIGLMIAMIYEEATGHLPWWIVK